MESALEFFKRKNAFYEEEETEILVSFMDEYAEQMSIVFADWLLENKMQPISGKWWDSIIGSEYYTAAELYKLYIKHLETLKP